MKRRMWVAAVMIGGAALLPWACSDDTETGGPPSSSSGAGGAAGGGGAGGSASGTGGINLGGNTPGCVSDDDCNGGVCNAGVCCDSAAHVCGDGCCTDDEVCLFDSCVTPGDDCVSAEDCPAGHYCEPALGAGTGGGGTGGNCTQPLEMGKCLPLPPTCDDEPDNPDCIEPCEYQPSFGQLDAVIKWQWGYLNPPATFPNKIDVWSTPTVGRIFDANCDGKVDLADPPNVAFVSADSMGTCCQCTSLPASQSPCKTGVLRLLDGRSGVEIWSLEKAEPSSIGFAGMSVAIGDADNDGHMDVVAITGEGKVAIVNASGIVTHLSTEMVPGTANAGFGWGGAVTLGDMNHDGWPEIAHGRELFTMAGGALTQLFVGANGAGAGISFFADVDGAGDLELVAGNTAYQYDGTTLWVSSAGDGFSGTGDFDGDGLPEIVLVRQGQLYLLEGATGAIELGPHTIPGTGSGGPPTVADFDGDGEPEIGVAMQNFYSMMKPDYGNATFIDMWSTPNHDNSSSVTGSSVFDFEGDGQAEVIYMDECFVWVYDGATGAIRFTANSQSFTAHEASMVADVDGDGHAEMLVIHNGANPTSWTCAHHTSGTDGYPIWSAPAAGAYRGVTMYGDSANSWVGTRTLWNQHAYSVTNICDPRDGACTGNPYYGEIPHDQQKNWLVPWLNNFRQNVQDSGLFDAPDAVVDLTAQCVDPVPLTVYLRNLGMSGLPAGVEVGIFKLPDVQLGSVISSKALMPGQTEIMAFTVAAGDASTTDTFYAEILVDPQNPTFHECRPGNNRSANTTADCVQ